MSNLLCLAIILIVNALSVAYVRHLARRDVAELAISVATSRLDRTVKRYLKQENQS